MRVLDEEVQLLFGLFARQTVQIDVPLNRVVAAAQAPEDARVQAWRVALDVLVRVRQIERTALRDQFAQLGERVRVRVQIAQAIGRGLGTLSWKLGRAADGLDGSHGRAEKRTFILGGANDLGLDRLGLAPLRRRLRALLFRQLESGEGVIERFARLAHGLPQ